MNKIENLEHMPDMPEIEELYFFEGTVYVSDIQVLLKERSFYHDRTLPFVVPRWKSLEIDEMIDLLTAETVIKNLSLVKKGGDDE